MSQRRSITADQADKLLEGLEEIKKAFIREPPYVSRSVWKACEAAVEAEAEAGNEDLGPTEAPPFPQYEDEDFA